MADYSLIQHAAKFDVVGGSKALNECCKNPANRTPPVMARDRADVSRQFCRVCGRKHIRFHAQDPTGMKCCLVLANLEQVDVTCEDDTLKRFQCTICARKQNRRYMGVIQVVTLD